MGAYYSTVRFLANALLGTWSGWDVMGLEHIPPRGGLIVASNHVSFWDPPLLGACLPRESFFLAKEELFSAPVLGPMIRGVNAIPIRRGMADLSGLTRATEKLRQGGVLLLFPEGSRMRDGALHPARPGVGMIAVQADVPIAPCYISGSNHPGKWWYRGARVRISLGRPAPWREYAGPESNLTPGRALYQRVGDEVMRRIAALKSDQLSSASRGAA